MRSRSDPRRFAAAKCGVSVLAEEHSGRLISEASGNCQSFLIPKALRKSKLRWSSKKIRRLSKSG